LSQVWDVRLLPCASETEALALEASEILLHDPPYNVVGRKGCARGGAEPA